MRSAKKTTHGRTYRALAGIGRIGFDRNLARGALPRHFAAKDSRKGISHAALLTEDLRPCAHSCGRLDLRKWIGRLASLIGPRYHGSHCSTRLPLTAIWL